MRASRRTVLRAAGLTVVAVGASRRAAAQDKIAPGDVMYQDTPMDGLRCDQCLHWQPPNACAIVSGEIKPEGWCGAFAPKA
jgi:hypothetical protein